MKVSQPNPIVDFITSGGNGKLTFIIPVYQRNYSWGKEDCEQLFEDVKNSIPKEGCPEKFHYFGNIVYDEAERDPFSGYIQYILIDGQQRITSTMLFLAAIRDEEEDESIKDNIDSTYLKNQDAPEDSKIKLKQIEMDRETYIKIINRDLKDINVSSAVYINYNKFRELIRNAKEKDGISSKELMMGLRALNVIVIDLQSRLPGSESAQVIFESINATGKPLSDADLLRNFLLFEIGVEKQDIYYNDYWLKIEQNIGNTNISDFLRRYLTLRLHKDVKNRTEYRTFKSNYKNFFTDAESAMAELTKYSEFYQWIKQPETLSKISPTTAGLLREADMLRLVPATPTLMWLLAKVKNNEIEFTEFDKVLKVIMDWSFRARVTTIITTGEVGEILTTKILELLEAKPEGKTYSEYLKYELSNYRAHDIYATDEQFKEAFVKYNFYKNYRRYAQEKLAQSTGHDKHLMLESIEHILPQSLDLEKWPNISTTDHAIWVNTIGNLVPMNQIDNSGNSNNGIEDKTKNLTISDWLLTREAVEYKIDGEWTIESIRKRGEAMAEKAIGIWEGPLVREREIEATSKNKTHEHMVKLIAFIKELALPNILPYPKQEKNSYGFNFHTQAMDNLFEIDNTDSVYCYSIIFDTDSQWGHVELTLCSHKKNLMTKRDIEVQNAIIEMSNNKPKEDWQYFKAIRWNNTSDDEEDIESDDLLRDILTNVIPEYERKLKEKLMKQ